MSSRNHASAAMVPAKAASSVGSKRSRQSVLDANPTAATVALQSTASALEHAMSHLSALDADEMSEAESELASDAEDAAQQGDDSIQAFPELAEEDDSEDFEDFATAKRDSEEAEDDTSSFDEDEDDEADHSESDSDNSQENDVEGSQDDSASEAEPHSAPVSGSAPLTTDDNDSDASPQAAPTPQPTQLQQLSKQARAIQSRARSAAAARAAIESRPRSLAELSDSSADENETGQALKHKNRIGSVPLEWYADEDHLGYNIKGERIARRAAGDEIDALLQRLDDPNFGRTIKDALNDESVVLTQDELNLLHRVRRGEYAHGTAFNPYADYDNHAFTEDIRHTMIGNAFEPKRRFIPSAHEAKRIVKLVNAIKNGWLQTKEQTDKARDAEKAQRGMAYLLWSADGSVIEDVDDAKKGLHRMPASVPPPRAQLPTHAYSYNPPREYLPTDEELAIWMSQPKEDQPYRGFIPQAFSSLREVPQYSNYIQERFERCLDLHLCPRTRRKKLNIDPESMIPVLPKPQELRPFPCQCSIEFTGHRGVIRSLTTSPDGQWLVSGAEDGLVKLWEASSGRCFKTWDFNLPKSAANASEQVIIECVAFNPNPELPLLAVCVGTSLVLLHTCTGSDAQMQRVQTLLKTVQDETPMGAQTDESASATAQSRQLKSLQRTSWKLKKEQNGRVAKFVALPDSKYAHMTKDEEEEAKQAEATNPAAAAAGDSIDSHPDVVHCSDSSTSALIIDTGRSCRSVAWHIKGDYCSSISRINNDASLVLIHRLSRQQTQSPFSKSKGLVSQVLFHPSKSFFFLATKRHVFIYNLLSQSLVKKLNSPCKWISHMSLHASGDHLITSSYDKKVCWYDLDLSSAPYKTLKYHTRAVRQVAFHPSYPLFVSAADDGKVHVFHSTVYTDLMTNPLIVPVKVLQGVTPCVVAQSKEQLEQQSSTSSTSSTGAKEAPGSQELGVMATLWHPKLPCVFAAGADAVIRLFT